MKLLKYAFLSTLLLTACGNNHVFDFHSNESLTIDEITYRVADVSCSSYRNEFQLIFSLKILSKNPKLERIQVINTLIIREDNGAEYKPGTISGSVPFDLECDKEKSVDYLLYIPTSIRENNYRFDFSVKNYSVRYHFWE